MPDYLTREYREALLVLRRWWDKGFIDPSVWDRKTPDIRQLYFQGRTIVRDWAIYQTWCYDPELDHWLDDQRKSVPDATMTPAAQLRSAPNIKPIQQVWNTFLSQVTVFGKQLENDRDRLHQIMQVCDVIGQDLDAKLLSGHGIEGEHYFYPEGETVPKIIPELASVPGAKLMDDYGFGWCFQGNVPTCSFLESRYRKVVDDLPVDPDGIYGINNLDRWVPMVTGPVTDENGEKMNWTAPSDRQSLDQIVKDVITGVKPVDDFDQWVEAFYDTGGRDWIKHATRIYLKYGAYRVGTSGGRPARLERDQTVVCKTTTSEKMANCTFSLRDGSRSRNDPDEFYPKIVEDAFQVFECEWDRSLAGLPRRAIL